MVAFLVYNVRGIGQHLVRWSDEVLLRIACWLRIPDKSTVGRLFKQVGGYPGANHIMLGVLVICCHQELTEGTWSKFSRWPMPSLFNTPNSTATDAGEEPTDQWIV